MNELLQRLQSDGPALSQRVLEEMYRDPFWGERFGTKGRRHADEDSDFHLRYLARALAAGDPAVLVRYARWLREVLATRGMCTRHLDENFRRLGEALAAQGWPATDLAVGFLNAARNALVWTEGPAAALQRDADRLADDIAQGQLESHARDLVSYLLDAVALGRPDLFATHVAWMEAHLARHGVAPGAWSAIVADLGRSLERDGTHPEAIECVRAATSTSR